VPSCSHCAVGLLPNNHYGDQMPVCNQCWSVFLTGKSELCLPEGFMHRPNVSAKKEALHKHKQVIEKVEVPVGAVAASRHAESEASYVRPAS